MADEIPQQTNDAAQTGIDSQSESVQSLNGKRKADSELKSTESQAKKMRESGGGSPEEGHDNGGPGDAEMTTTNQPIAGAGSEEGDKLMTKGELKRLRKQQAHEAWRQGRKEKRKEKRHEKQARKRAEKEAKIAEAEAAGLDPVAVLRNPDPWTPCPVPVAFIIDCDFEKYMREPEIVSLSSQITRAYSQNRRAKYQAHLWVSSWQGKLQTRFETVLKNAHINWKGVQVMPGNFCNAARSAKELMARDGDEVIDLIKPREDGQPALVLDDRQPDQAEPESAEDIDQSVVYLTSESPYTLTRLEANTCYVIGGIVDRNREKGLCYRRAKEHKVRTAKLPIGQYMAMQSRYVLTTNQVVEIMVKWLECGDWGDAFTSIIPKRKGGTLKSSRSSVEANGEDGGQGDGDDEEQEEGEERGASGVAEDGIGADVKTKAHGSASSLSVP
ncbi:guanine-1-methyltransferase-domain-containing protein [Apodospora peruviana]|uniref:tRNA (guanine(9)-N1)-methyltransferase n=1 Tax=Apodospora peruviana TaxID=516989 RepID=A0AAE0IAK3_9PEZI|nr:guanine-1-methyltransferase-domain-containing protein [Apodospora peruviana]